MRENHYAILASVSEFPTFTNYKISITLLIISRCHDRKLLPTAKLIIKFEINAIIPQKFCKFISHTHNFILVEVLIFGYYKFYDYFCNEVSMVFSLNKRALTNRLFEATEYLPWPQTEV